MQGTMGTFSLDVKAEIYADGAWFVEWKSDRCPPQLIWNILVEACAEREHQAKENLKFAMESTEWPMKISEEHEEIIRGARLFLHTTQDQNQHILQTVRNLVFSERFQEISLLRRVGSDMESSRQFYTIRISYDRNLMLWRAYAEEVARCEVQAPSLLEAKEKILALLELLRDDVNLDNVRDVVDFGEIRNERPIA